MMFFSIPETEVTNLMSDSGVTITLNGEQVRIHADENMEFIWWFVEGKSEPVERRSVLDAGTDGKLFQVICADSNGEGEIIQPETAGAHEKD